MLDGIKATSIIDKARRSNQIEFSASVVIETGEQIGNSEKGEFESYNLEIFQVNSDVKKERLNIYGSLHKNHHKGRNVEPFTHEQVKKEVCHLSQGINIDSAKIALQNLEIGVNLPFWSIPIEFLDSDLLIFQNSEFVKYVPDKQGNSIGYVCKKTNYSIKIYDKGLQNNLPANLLRFEIKIIKMRELKKYGIKTFADLADPSKVKPLISLLEKAWCEVLIYDIPEIPSNISASQRRFLEDCRYKDYWSKLNKCSNQKFRDAKRRFKELSEKYGSGTHAKILELIRSEWEKRFENSTDFTGCQTSDPTTDFTIFTNTVKGEIREPSLLPAVVLRSCQTCGKDISLQRRGSAFCSETMFGKEAKRCRNKDSNPRNNQKTKIDRFNRIGPTLFDVGPYNKF